MKAKYIIVGSNNFWYTTTEPVNSTELQEEINNIKEGITRGDYNHSDKPAKLFAVEVTGTEENFDV